MTDEEKKELEKLDKGELIDLLDQYKADAEAKRAADKRAIIERFFGSSPSSKKAKDKDDGENEDEEDDDADPLDLSKNEAFKKLKQKINRR